MYEKENTDLGNESNEIKSTQSIKIQLPPKNLTKYIHLLTTEINLDNSCN